MLDELRGGLAACLLALTAVSPAFAAGPAGAAPPSPCDRPECRQFDFWLGEWDVMATDGKTPIGRSEIQSILGGCVVLENWYGKGGADGKSFNIWTKEDSLWHQSWVSSIGGKLELKGSFHDGKMVLEGGSSSRQPGGTQNRISYTPMPDGQMEQRWDLSTDGGATWKTTFLGIYRKKGAAK